MYLQHFGLSRNPFSLTPDPRFLFLTEEHREALAALLFAVRERKGFMVMTGDAGTGKTTLTKKLLLSVPITCAQFGVIVNPALTRSELLEYILLEFGERRIPESKALRLSLFRRILQKAEEEERTCVVVIDEAHLLTAELVEEIRLLSNIETSEQKLLQVILSGQSELNTVLDLESMRQVKQRVAVRTHIHPLNHSQIKTYLRTRWERASATAAFPFSAEAVELIARASGGIPRTVNAICDAALVNACGSGTVMIGTPGIHEVLRDLAIAPARVPQDNGPSPVAATLPANTVSQPELKMRATIPSLERYAAKAQKNRN